VEIERLKKLLPEHLIQENDTLRPQVAQLTNSNTDLVKRLNEAVTKNAELADELARYKDAAYLEMRLKDLKESEKAQAKNAERLAEAAAAQEAAAEEAEAAKTAVEQAAEAQTTKPAEEAVEKEAP
jgi:colicin import membrane protein